jgi:prevent-host-death family protein
MVIRIGAREARNNFAELLGKVHYGRQAVIVERSGKPMVAIIPADLYAQVISEQEARFGVLDRIRQQAPELSPEEVQADVSEAVDAVRANASGRA